MKKLNDNPSSNSKDDQSNKNIFWMKATLVFIVVLIVISTVVTVYLSTHK